MMNLLQPLIDLAIRHSRDDQDGLQPTPVPGLSIARGRKGRRTAMIYKPSIGLILQGSKSVVSGDSSFNCRAGSLLAASSLLPTTGIVQSGTAAEPYLSLMIEIDTAFVRTLMQNRASSGSASLVSRGILLSQATAEIIDAFGRLMRCLSSPEQTQILAPMIMKEILYWFSQSSSGDILSLLVSNEGHLLGIRNAITLISKNYASKINFSLLAQDVGLSQPTFYRNFKKSHRPYSTQLSKANQASRSEAVADYQRNECYNYCL